MDLRENTIDPEHPGGFRRPADHPALFIHPPVPDLDRDCHSAEYQLGRPPWVKFPDGIFSRSVRRFPPAPRCGCFPLPFRPRAVKVAGKPKILFSCSSTPCRPKICPPIGIKPT